MRRHGQPIQTLSAPGISTGVSYPLHFEGWRAAIRAGLDLERWESGGYDPRFMARVVAWYRIEGMIEQHASQAAYIAGKKAAHKGK